METDSQHGKAGSDVEALSPSSSRLMNLGATTAFAGMAWVKIPPMVRVPALIMVATMVQVMVPFWVKTAHHLCADHRIGQGS